MISLKINTSDHHDKKALYRHAVSLGLKTAAFMALYELLLHYFYADTMESFRILKYLVLFLAMGYGTHKAQKWIRLESPANDTMVFGLVMSAFTAFGAILFDVIVTTFNYHLEISDTILPIDDPFKFGVNAIATFWTCMILGAVSAFIFVNLYKRM